MTMIRETIRESEYGSSPNNVHIDRFGNTLSVCPTYPQINDLGIKFIEINQESVRASDGIRLTYDYARDGWSIQQPTILVWRSDDKVCDEGWKEVAFVQSWALSKEQEA